MILKYIGGIALSIGWIWTVVVAISYGGGVGAILFSIVLAPVFAFVEAFMWGSWIPLVLCWPGFGLYMLGVQLDGGRG